MGDYRLLYDSDYLYAFHLQGKEATVEIERVTGGKLKDKDGKESKKPFLYFKGKQKPLALNKTNGATVATLYGKDTRAWVGKRITLYPTTTQAFGAVHDCVRIKPHKPSTAELANGGAYDEAAEPLEPGAAG